MTGPRYDAYRGLLRRLERVDLRVGERGVLRDAAEGFLLARGDPSFELAGLGLGVSIVLDRAVSTRRLTQRTADELGAAVEACGPRGAIVLAA
jgi:hypothetical protein